MNSGAGRLDRRLQFQVRVEMDDGHGNTVSDFYPQFTMAASRVFLKSRNSETVMAARLTAKALATVTVRNCTAARQITADWRAIDTRDGTVWNIREEPQQSSDRGYLEFLCESGVAA
ncbi:head-tail adaptor protein [Mesorhizobium sp.]|uniref:head-tail adaptor protein n=1 Tax=Mesorhizobium sp. TaxID=1871066 RepID=UPI001208874F|nr:head-tail adaptor protein [Mesorhizobium sp.]TIN83103.1 MAG: head-tail adaptor protein [Mesorhizobium sp.]